MQLKQKAFPNLLLMAVSLGIHWSVCIPLSRWHFSNTNHNRYLRNTNSDTLCYTKLNLQLKSKLHPRKAVFRFTESKVLPF